MLNSEERLRISKGSDHFPILSAYSFKTKRYFDLTDVTNIQVILERRDRTKLVLDMNTIPAVKAKIITNSITFIAQNAGNQGNGIVLNFNGVDDIDAIVLAWNDSNPANTVEHNHSDGTIVIAENSYRLTGGYNSYNPIEIFGNPLEGRIKLYLYEKDTSSLRNGNGQTLKIIIDRGENPGGIRTTGYFEQKVDVIGD